MNVNPTTHIPIFLTAILLSVCFIGAGQDRFYDVMPMEAGLVTYSRVVEIDSISKATLFGRLKDWAVKSYGSQAATLQSEDKEAGYLAYKGFLPVTAYGIGGLYKGKPYNIHLYHTLKFYIKDGRYKIVFDDLRTYSPMAQELIGYADKIPLEQYGKEAKAKHQAAMKKDIESFDQTINKLFESIIAAANSKSSFDF